MPSKMEKAKKSIKVARPPSSRAGGARPGFKPLRQVSLGHQTSTISAPAAVSGRSTRRRTPPVEISMREEVSDVLVAEAFANSAALINPANSDLFPWLSEIAQAFTTFFFKKLIFEYVPSTSTQLGGTIALAVNANPNAPLFDTVKQTLNHEGAATCAPWESIKINALTLSNQSREPFKLVEDTTGIESIFDELYNIACGVVQIVTAVKNIITAPDTTVSVQNGDMKVAVSSVPRTDTPVVCGKLFVDYTVVLMDPTDETVSDDGVDLYQTLESVDTFDFPYPLVASPFPGTTAAGPLRTSWEPVTESKRNLRFAESGIYAIHLEAFTQAPVTFATVYNSPALNITCLGGAETTGDTEADGLVFTDAGTISSWSFPTSTTQVAGALTSFYVRINNPDTDYLEFSNPDGQIFGGAGSYVVGCPGILSVSKVNNDTVGSGLNHALSHRASCPGLRASGGILSLYHSVRRSKASGVIATAQHDSKKQLPSTKRPKTIPLVHPVLPAAINTDEKDYTLVSRPSSAPRPAKAESVIPSRTAGVGGVNPQTPAVPSAALKR